MGQVLVGPNPGEDGSNEGVDHALRQTGPQGDDKLDEPLHQLIPESDGNPAPPYQAGRGESIVGRTGIAGGGIGAVVPGFNWFQRDRVLRLGTRHQAEDGHGEQDKAGGS
jgi:hypothetical protein